MTRGKEYVYTHRCDVCGKTFKTERGLKQHIARGNPCGGRYRRKRRKEREREEGQSVL